MSHAPTAPVKYAGRSYLIEFSAVMLLYVAAVLGRPWLIAHSEGSNALLAAKLVPIIPIWLMLVAVWRHYRRIDEFAKRRFLETLAIAFGVGSCAIVSYAFLVDAGLPELAITWAWPTLAASWGITSAIFSIADRAK